MRLLYIKFAGSDYCYVYNFNGSEAEQNSRLKKFMNKMGVMGVVCSIIKGKKVYYVAVHNNYEDFLKELGVIQTSMGTNPQPQIIEDFYDDKGLLYGMNEVKEGGDNINPSHYKLRDGLQVIDCLEDLNIAKDYCHGNAIKYLMRAGRKGSAVEDFKKAQWYLNKLISLMEKK